jgi:RNA polymerase sigma factor (sigma-70 family)
MATDQRLTRRASEGEQRAFAAIFDRYHQRLYRYCLAIVGNPHDAQDALQNAMVKVLRALPGERREIDLKPWLYRIAHNESIDLLRRRREGAELDAELADPGASLAEEAAARERLRRLLSDLDELPERQRGTLLMRELAGLGFEEIGSALGTSAAVARQTLYEARLGLREMDEGREMRCEAVTRALSDGDGRSARRRDIRAHLRGCADCRGFRAEIATRKRDLAAISPLPAALAAGLLKGLLGTQASGGGGAAALGGGAAKTVGTSAAVKGAATVAVVAAIGVGAADRGGLIDLGPGHRDDRPAQAQPSDPDRGAPADRPAGTEAGDRRSVAPPRAEARARIEAARARSSRPASVARSKAPGANETGEPPAAPASGSDGIHPSGRGHQKQLPAAAAHGQETAAAHKSGGRGAKQAQGHAAKPEHPSHPSHPATPATEKPAPSTPPPSSADGEPSPSESGDAAEPGGRGATAHEAAASPGPTGK